MTLDTVVKAVTDASVVAGRRVRGHAQPADRRPAPLAAIETPEDLAKITVAFRNGAPLRLGDVADVKVGFPPPIGDAVINDGEGLLLIVEKQPTGNTLEVTRNVEKALERPRPGLKGVDIDPTIFRPADVHRAVARQPQRGDAHRLRPGGRSSWSRSCSTGGRR